MLEPLLRPDDTACWEQWRTTFLLHSRTANFRSAVESAKRLIDRELSISSSPQVSWSGGKDSTALTHLVVVGCNAREVRVVSEKDDLDYPGEEDYVRGLARSWGARLDVVRPKLSPREFIARRAAAMSASEDVHGRGSALSRACFYGVMEAANVGHDLVMMGLRADESGHRRSLRMARGRSYEIVNGTRRAHPLMDWTGQDVLTYLQVHGIDPLPVYRCVALMHAREPWRIRKSWWLPGRSAGKGQMAWLRRYWPSLFAQARDWFPDAMQHA